jgi:hypothetical protein
MADSDEYTGLVPDSDLENPQGVQPVYYVIADGMLLGILPNDWVDLDDTIRLDPLWGSRFQVYQCFNEYITVRMLDGDDRVYREIAVDPKLVWNNFRRVAKEEP